MNSKFAYLEFISNYQYSKYRVVHIKYISYARIDYNKFGFLLNICLWRVKETSQRDVSFKHLKHMIFWQLFDYFINRTYYLNPVCSSFNSNYRVYRKIVMQKFTILLYCNIPIGRKMLFLYACISCGYNLKKPLSLFLFR